MKTGRRILSLVLAVTMLLGCMCIQAAAADEQTTLTISKFQKFDEATDTISENAITEAGNGNIIVVTIAIKNNTSSKISVGSYSTSLEYDTKVVTPYQNVATEDEAANEIPFGNWGNSLAGGEPTVNPDVEGESGLMTIAWASSSGKQIKANGTTDFVQVAFKVLADAETGAAKFSLKTDDKDGVFPPEGDDFSFNVSDAVSLSINGVTPEIGSVTLTAAEGTTLGEKNTVTVKGGDSATQKLKVTVLSKKGNDITDRVSGSLSETSVTATQGVTLITKNDAPSSIWIAGNATAATYTYTVSGVDGKSTGSAGVNFTVVREAAVPTSIEITGGVKTIYLPGNVAIGNEFESTTYSSAVQYWESQAFTATVKDQYGDVIKNPNVTWTFDVTDGQSVATQYRHATTHDYYPLTEGQEPDDNCELYRYIFGQSTTAAAGLEISASGHLMITNSCGTGTATVKATCGEVSATKQVTVQKADSQVASVTIAAVGSANVVTVPDDSRETSVYYALSATVKDQYGKTLTDKTVTWSIVDAEGTAVSVTGMGISELGDYLFLNNSLKTTIRDTTGKDYYLKAACDGVSATQEFNVRRAESVATRIAIYKDDVEITGDTDTITIPTSGNKTTDYTAKVLDQYGAPMSAKAGWVVNPTSIDNFSYTKHDDKSSITFKVTSDVAKNTNISLTAYYGSVGNQKTKKITVSLKDIEITAPTVTTKTAPTYGDTWADIVTGITGGSAKLNNDTVSGTFFIRDEDKAVMPAAGENKSVQVYFTSTKGDYKDIPVCTVTVNVAKKPLTAKVNDAEITYGEDAPTFTVTYSGGFVGTDDASVFTGLTFTHVYHKGNAATTYAVAASGATADNYEVTNYTQGHLTVKPKMLTAGMVDDITGTFTYTGKAQTPAVTVKDNGEALVKNTDYAAAYSYNISVGTAKVAIAGSGNYTGKVEKNFTITKAQLTIDSATFADKTYDGKPDATVTDVTFTGLVNGEKLTLGTDYTATGEFVSADAATSVKASVTVTLKDTDAAKNYTLTSGTLADAGSAEIKPTQTTLTLTAKNAVYTASAYAASNITANSNVENPTVTYTYYADNSGEQGTALTSAPTNAGTYWVSGYIARSGNNSEVTSAAVKFQITKAPLTIAVDAKEITYGEAAPSYTATYTGLKTGDTASVVTGLTLSCDYQQYGNAGSYTITASGAAAANYTITCQPGTLTVNQKTVNLQWSDVSALYYDGTVKNVTASVKADDLVNGDEVTPVVLGGSRIEIGTYTAFVTESTGDKAGNYTVNMSDASKSFEIKPALESVTVIPETITATVDHKSLTIELTGYRGASETVTVTGNNGSATADANGKLTVHGVEYTVDASGVVVNNSDVTITETTPNVTGSDAVGEEGYTPDSASSGLDSAAAEEVIDEAEQDATITKVELTLEISVKSYTTSNGTKEFKLEITPKVTYKDEDGNTVGETETLPNSAIKAPVTIKIKLPGGMVNGTSAQMFAKHLLSSGGFEYLPVTITEESGSYYASWQQSSFSEVTLYQDNRFAWIYFALEDGGTIYKQYTAADIGTNFPTDSKTGKTFSGWELTPQSSTTLDGTYTTLTDDLLTKLSVDTYVSAEPVFTTASGDGSGSSGSSSSGSSGNFITGKHDVTVGRVENGSVNVSPASARAGGTVTVTATPNAGYTVASVTVTTDSGKRVSVTSVGGNRYSFVMPDGDVTVRVTFTASGVNGFVDVPANKYFYDAVNWAVANGITSGTDTTHFSPYASCTRGQLVTFLWRAAGKPDAKSTVNPFTDAKESSSFYKAILWAAENGIVTGYSDGSFKPNAAVSRQQTAAILYRYAKVAGMDVSVGEDTNILSFNDALSVSEYAVSAIQWAVGEGIMQGNKGDLLPHDTCTRAQIVTFLYRTYQG